MHPALLKTSGWKWSPRLRELNAAQAWPTPSPGYYDNLPKTERLDILAWYEVQWRVSAINNYEMQKEAERNARRKTGKK